MSADPYAATEPHRAKPKASRLKRMLLIIAPVVLLIVGVYMLMPDLAGPKALPKGADIMVGKHRFVYACSVFDIPAAATSLGLNRDSDKQNVQESYSLAPDKTDKEIDILKSTGQQKAHSACTVGYDRMYDTANGERKATYITVALMVEQFADEQSATKAYDQLKQAAGDGVQALADFSDASYYPAPSKENGVQPVIRHQNLIISYQMALAADDVEATRALAGLNTIAKDTVKRIDRGEGQEPRDFSGLTSVGPSPFVDTCQATDLASVARNIGGGAQIDPFALVNVRSYGHEEKEGDRPQLSFSTCRFSFRTAEDIEAQAGRKQSAKDSESQLAFYTSNYPHYTTLQIINTASPQDAKKIITHFKKSGAAANYAELKVNKIEDANIGDMSVKTGTAPSKESEFEDVFYYIAKDSYAYVISVTFKRSDNPYQTTKQKITEKEIGKVLKDLIQATERTKEKVRYSQGN